MVTVTINSGLFTSNKQDWETPTELFNNLNEKYNFTYDLAARSDNAKCKKFISPEQNSLNVDWSLLEGNLFCNPPYGRELSKWVQKAYETSLEKSEQIVFIIPARTDTSYWHDYIFNKAEVIFIRGRLKFEVDGIAKDAAPFPSAIVIFNGKSYLKNDL